MKALKIVGYIAASAAALVVLAASIVYLISYSKLRQTVVVNVRPISIPTDQVALARGKHIAHTRGCVDCHGADLGGAKVIEDAAMGRVYGSNLTRGKGSRTAEYTDADWVRAIRHGVARDNRALFLMPSDEYSHLSDEDVASVIAYLKSLPPVDRDSVPLSLGPISRMLVATGKMKLPATVIDHTRVQPQSIAKAVNAEYGRYLANGCTGCHGANFSGGKIEIGPPNWPLARNLTPHESSNLSKWTDADFIRAMREGRRPDGSEISPVMPRAFGAMDDVELAALYTFFKSLPPTPTGDRTQAAPTHEPAEKRDM